MKKIKFVNLEDVCSEIIDCPHSTPKWLEKGIPVIRNYNLVNGYIDKNTLSYVDEATYKERIKRGRPVEDDIIISREAPMGAAGIVPAAFKCCLGQRVVLLKPNKIKVDPYYLLYAFLSKPVQNQISQINKTGSIVSNLNIKDLKRLQIPIIDLKSQRIIANKVKNIDSKIANNNAISKELESMAKTIYNYWFLQFEFPDKDGKPYKSNGGKMVWNDQLKQEIPEGWEVKKLKDIIVENPKSKIKVKEAQQDHFGSIPFFTSGQAILSTEERLVTGINCYLNTGGNADVKYFYGPASYSTDTWSIRGKEYLEYLLPFILKNLQLSMDSKFFQGTGLRHLQKPLLKDYAVLVPNKEIINKFISLVSNILKKVSDNYRENIELEKMRDFLLPLLMNGQVTID